MSEATKRVTSYDPFAEWSFLSGRCFLCGSNHNVATMPVFPEWLGLHERHLFQWVDTLGGKQHMAEKITLHVCEQCWPAVAANDALVRRAWRRGATSLRELEREALYLWICRLYWGLLSWHIGDASPEQRSTLESLSEEKIAAYQQLHVFMAGFFGGIEVDGGPPPWSVFVASTQFRLDSSDIEWHFVPGVLALAVRSRNAGVICCLEDEGVEALQVRDDWRKLEGMSLHPVQFEEWWVAMLEAETLRVQPYVHYMIPVVRQPDAGLRIESFGEADILKSVGYKPVVEEERQRLTSSYRLKYHRTLSDLGLSRPGGYCLSSIFSSDGSARFIPWEANKTGQPATTALTEENGSFRNRAFAGRVSEADVQTLLQGLARKTVKTRAIAARRLGMVRDPQAVEALQRALLTEESKKVRVEAYYGLSTQCDVPFEETVRSFLEDAYDRETDEARSAVLYALDVLADPGAPIFGQLLDAVEDASSTVRWSALRRLADDGYPEIGRVAASMSHDKSDGVRALAKRIVAEQPEWEDVPTAAVQHAEPTPSRRADVPKPVIAAPATVQVAASTRVESSSSEASLHLQRPTGQTGEQCEHCGAFVDFTETGACPACGGFQGWPAGMAPRLEERWMEQQQAGERVLQRVDAERPFVESTTKQENFMVWVLAAFLVLGVLALLARCAG